MYCISSPLFKGLVYWYTRKITKFSKDAFLNCDVFALSKPTCLIYLHKCAACNVSEICEFVIN